MVVSPYSVPIKETSPKLIVQAEHFSGLSSRRWSCWIFEIPLSQKNCINFSQASIIIFTTERVSPITFIDASNFVFMIITNAVAFNSLVQVDVVQWPFCFITVLNNE